MKHTGAKEKTEHSGKVVTSAINAMDEIKQLIDKSASQVENGVNLVNELSVFTVHGEYKGSYAGDE